MKKEDFFKLFNLFSKKDTKVKQTEKEFSKIIDFKFEQLEDYDKLNFNNCIKGTFIIRGNNNENYTIITKTSEFLDLDVNVYYNNGKKVEKVRSYGKIHINNQKMIYDFSRIDNKNPNFLHIGFGRMMMEAMFKTLDYYASIYDFEFEFVSGTIEVGADAIPERSIPLYKSFDNYKINDKKILVLKQDTCNIKEREIFYKVV